MQDNHDKQLALLPNLPVVTKNTITKTKVPLSPRKKSDVGDDVVDEAILYLSGLARQQGWRDIESYDKKDYERVRDRLREQRRFDGSCYTGMALLWHVTDIIVADDFLCNRKSGGMSVAWIIGPMNFRKICTGQLGRSNNAAKNSVSPYTAELMR